MCQDPVALLAPQAPPIRFLSRDSVVNVKLGKALHKMRTGGKRAGGRS